MPAVLFDLDGTLIDSNYQPVDDAWSEALLAAGIVIPRWTIHRRVGMSGKSMIQELLCEIPHKTDKIDLDQLERKYDSRFRRVIQHLKPLPGAIQLMKHLLRHGIRFAIATTSGRLATSPLLKRVEVPAGTPIVTGDDVQRAMPSPDVFEVAARHLNVPISDCIASVTAYGTCWRPWAEALWAWVSYQVAIAIYGEEELEHVGAFRVYSDAADMLMHIEQLGLPGK